MYTQTLDPLCNKNKDNHKRSRNSLNVPCIRGKMRDVYVCMHACMGKTRISDLQFCGQPHIPAHFG